MKVTGPLRPQVWVALPCYKFILVSDTVVSHHEVLN
jgi:hypothetical protein